MHNQLVSNKKAHRLSYQPMCFKLRGHYETKVYKESNDSTVIPAPTRPTHPTMGTLCGERHRYSKTIRISRHWSSALVSTHLFSAHIILG